MKVSPLISRMFFFWSSSSLWSVIRTAVCAALVLSLSSLQPAGAAVVKTIVRMETNVGPFNIGLYDDDAPETVKNFLRYVDDRAYDNTLIHRSEPGLIQGGGYLCDDAPNCHIDRYGSIVNEYSSSNQNFRGTIAMARGADLNSATSEWFINLSDANATAFEGYTVFGEVLGSGMDDVVVNIANLNTIPFYVPPLVFQAPIFKGSYVFFYRVCRNDDGDGVCSETENLAPGGSGDEDNIADSEQANVASILTSAGDSVTFSANTGMIFEIAGAIKKNDVLFWLEKKFEPPPGESVHFNNGILRFLMTGVMNTTSEGEIVTLYDRAATRPTRYYAYGPTKDDPTSHWYDFSYDGVTGAEIKDDRIILHFVDNERGDDDFTKNNSITHTGGQAVVTPIASAADAQSGGCSIAAKSSQAWRAGDWALVAVFLVVLAVLRKRARRG